MTLGRKDLAATALTVLVVLVFLATHEGWNVWLVGDSRRWAAAVIVLLGAVTCALGSPAESSGLKLFAPLGVAALVLAVLALVTGSLTVLSLLVAVIVVLWAASTVRHATHAPHRPIAA